MFFLCDLANYVDFYAIFVETKFYSYDNRKKRRAENIAFGSTV